MKNQNTAVLIIDDDETSNYVASKTLHSAKSGLEVKTVLNGLEAIEFYKKNPDKIPQYALLDINMPLMNGFEFLRWYSNSVFKGQTKIVMFTTSIRKEERDRANEYEDVVAYVEKPLLDSVASRLF